MKNYENLLKTRYVCSILIDLGIIFLPFFYLDINENIFFSNIFYTVLYMILSVSYFYIGDLMFQNRSIGKLIMGIKLIDKEENSNAKLGDIIARRISENLLFPLFFIDVIYVKLQSVLYSKIVFSKSKE